MSEKEKAKTLLKILSQVELKFNGAREAFVFTQSYEWLLELAKKLEAKENENAN